VNLRGSIVTGKVLRDYLQQNPITNLKEIILIDQAGNIELAHGGDDAWEEGKANELRALDWIVHHLDGDLVLLANGDVPALLRRGSRVWLDCKGLVLWNMVF
jgi:hypothetical protein